MLRVVVIDEDAAMRALLCEWVNEEGHQALALPSLDAAGAIPALCTVLLLDLVNPRTRGVDTVQKARARFPGAALVGWSAHLGRSLGSRSELARDLGLFGLLSKPCSRAELLAALVAAGSSTCG